MLEKLETLIKNSYAPYSNFHVSAIVVTKDGNTFEGVNIENSSFGATICAERVAITSAVSKGYKKNDFKEIHILTDSKNIGMPCFICRQVFIEFFDETTKIYVYNHQGKVKNFNLDEICPLPFGRKDLK